jgi:site-specific DNA-methyltransferase (adenine-specific)
MGIYYQDDFVTLYHGDCIEVSPRVGPVDLMVTDPPYGVEFQSGWGEHAKIANDDGSADVRAMILDVAVRLRRSRHAYIFGAWDFTGTILSAQAELIWDKGIVGMGDLTSPWGRSHEPITFAIQQTSKAARERGSGALSARLRRGSVLRVDRTNGGSAKRHPTEKPVALLRRLIESSSSFGETVFDPFVGVGSTLVAASLEGRKSVGIEIEERYCEIAATRLETINAALATLKKAS